MKERADWLSRLPEHWETKSLKYVAPVNDEVLPETTPEDAEISCVEISDVSFGHGVTNSTFMQFGEAPSRARRVVKGGDLIVSTVRTYLKAIALIEEPAPGTIVSTGFAVLRPHEIDSAGLPALNGFTCSVGFGREGGPVPRKRHEPEEVVAKLWAGWM